MQNEELEYVGFWPRFVASVVDSIIATALTAPLSMAILGESYFQQGAGASVFSQILDFSTSNLIIGSLCIFLWLFKQATPGKMLFKARIVDAETGGRITKGQAISRYLAYFISAIPGGLGFLWVAFDSKKQGWHDKLAGTVVVRSKAAKPLTQAEPVTFN